MERIAPLLRQQTRLAAPHDRVELTSTEDVLFDHLVKVFYDGSH